MQRIAAMSLTVYALLWASLFVGTHKTIFFANIILKCPLEALCNKGFLLISC